ncbi:MAG: DoxX family protein [Bacteroidetes bacterium]|nr:DoxX family protein [Bacteroidota bacterium]
MKLITTTVARILFAIPFLAFGLMHFAFAENMGKAIPSFLPGGVLWVYLSGAGLIAAAVSLFIQKMVTEAMFGLSLFLVSAVALIHMPGMGNPDPMMQQMAMSGLLKDIGLLGGALSYAGIYAKK